MALTRGRRRLLEVFAPPLLGSVLGILLGVIMHLARGGGLDFLWLQRRDYLVTFFWAYLLGGLPSLGYMFIMEWRYDSGLDPGSWRSVGLSALLGGVAGVVMIAPFSPRDPGAMLYLGGLGAAVGFILGWLIKRLSAVRARDQTR